MTTFRVQLFGQFRVSRNGRSVLGLEATRVRELFCYLLLNRGQRHRRESVAGLLWDNRSTAQARKHLRQALWQLQVALEPPGSNRNNILVVDPERVSLNPGTDLWLDVAEFERAHIESRALPAESLDIALVRRLQDAAELYQGDLLEDCEQEWCMYERERLRLIHAAVLDKLIAYCEAHGAHDDEVAYCQRLLRQEPASERAHRRLMSLYFSAGDRTSALRQYQRCVAVLAEELGVEPARKTRELFEQIKADRPDPRFSQKAARLTDPSFSGIEHLRRLQSTLAALQGELQREIDAVERDATQGGSLT